MIPPHRRAHPFFPKVRPHAPDTLQTPPHHQLSWLGRLKRMLWVAGRRLKERDSKFAIKAGMASSLLALPAFLESTRPTFVEYWGDWALISVGLFSAPSFRFIDTCDQVFHRDFADNWGCECLFSPQMIKG